MSDPFNSFNCQLDIILSHAFQIKLVKYLFTNFINNVLGKVLLKMSISFSSLIFILNKTVDFQQSLYLDIISNQKLAIKCDLFWFRPIKLLKSTYVFYQHCVVSFNVLLVNSVLKSKIDQDMSWDSYED